MSAFLFPGGAPEAAYRQVATEQAALITSPEILAELGRILSSKFEWAPERSEAAIAGLIEFAEIVRPTRRLRVVARDPTDDRILEAAFAGEADLIVSGDKDLLDLGAWEGIPIRTPAEFVASGDG